MKKIILCEKGIFFIKSIKRVKRWLYNGGDGFGAPLRSALSSWIPSPPSSTPHPPSTPSSSPLIPP